MVNVVNDDDVQARPFVPPNAKPLNELSPPQVISRLLQESRLVRVVAFFGHAFSGTHDVAASASRGWKNALQAYEDFGRHCAQSGLRCASFFIRMGRTPKTDAFVKEKAARAQRLGLPFTDMLPWFEDRDWRRLVNSAVDPHPNAEGHRIITENMARTLFPR